MVNIKKNFLAVAYLASFSVAMPSQPNVPQQPSTPTQPFFFGIIPKIFGGIFGRGSGDDSGGSDITQKFWDAVSLAGGYLPSDEELQALGIPPDSPLWDKYSEFFTKKGEDILAGNISPEAISSALEYFRGS